MNDIERKQQIETALKAFSSQPLREAALGLLDSLGYRSDLTLKVTGVEEFRHVLDQGNRLNEASAKIQEWKNIEFLRQITGSDISISPQELLPFQKEFSPTEIQSYVFLAIELKEYHYTRTDLSQITRAVNRVFDMPAMLLFKYGPLLTIAVINRRLNKLDETRDVLEKVTLVKDIVHADPLRAHVDILHDLTLESLYHEYYFHNFVGLHQAWDKRLASYALNERFYREIANWFFWALRRPGVKLPRSVENIKNVNEREKQRSIFFIRLLTRLIFCWFLQEKGFLPRDLFRLRVAKGLLKDWSPDDGTYYKAILQNLFFATLNQERKRRGWRKKYDGSRDGNRGVTNLWRYQDLLKVPAELETLLRERIPFVNGGLFDCLDEVSDHGKTPNIRLDDFSEETDNSLCLPNELFFGEAREVDLSLVYEDTRRKKEKVCGLIEILSRYKFTVEENTPLEEEVALDPELLGKVFENLLASYNEDTSTTARKALGAFYTPRKIVSYMVDQALVSYLTSQVPSLNEATVKELLAGDAETLPDLTQQQRMELVRAIGRVKILDPACGSGAFPMGALHRLVDLLQKLDPNNESWKRDRLAEAETYCELLRQTNAPRAELAEVEDRMEDIRRSFDTRFHALDFARKLYLIENCIYGVDIQPIACQIAKLRFFIALIVDQHIDLSADDLGVRPLPNLETKIVAADSLVGVRQFGQQLLRNTQIDAKESELRKVRERHFLARTPQTKAKCREQDGRLRGEIASLLIDDGWDISIAQKLASWDPYDQNHAAPFFDSEWMFGIRVGKIEVDGRTTTTLLGKLPLVNETRGQMELAGPSEVESGFDIVIGNPPYVRLQTLKQKAPDLVDFYKHNYESAKKGNYDLYVIFVESGLKLLKPNGHLAYILPHKFFNAQYGEPLRALLAKGRHLQHIVHFGDQQVFPGASNYVCLMFLAKSGSQSCRVVRVEDLKAWFDTLQGTEGLFQAQAITSDEWNFSVGRESGAFNMLKPLELRLGDVVGRIYQGPITSADPVFLFKEFRATDDGTFIATSKSLSREVEIEGSILKHVVRSGDIGPYWAKPEALVLFPYEVNGTSARLYTCSEMEDRFPLAWDYLSNNMTVLKSRENDSFADSNWFRFGRTQNLGLWEQPKLMIPYMITRLSAYLDVNDHYYFINVTTGGYGITTSSDLYSLPVLCALMNSPVLDFFLKRVSSNFRGGYFAANKQFIEQLPVAKVSLQQKSLIVNLVNHQLLLNRHIRKLGGSDSARDALMEGYWAQVLNGLVYELYFPVELHGRNLHIFDVVRESDFPTLDDIPEPEAVERLRAVFERTYDLKYPLRSVLHDLQTVEVIRIIEGR